MKKNDYKTEFEEQRKEINLEDDEKVLSRVDLHSKNKKVNKRSRFSLINVLLITFTLIPISIFAFVIISIYTSENPIKPKADDNEIQFETSDKNDKENDVLSDKEEQEKQKKEAEEKKKKEELAQAEAEKKAAAEEEERKQEEAKRQEEEAKKAAQLKEEERQKEIARQQAEEQKKKEEENKGNANQGGKTHTVAPGETLYRISVNYYQSGDGVEKIKSANGLSSNSISVGQTLVIP